MFSRVTIALPPFSSTLPKPPRNISNAPEASRSNAALNSSPDTPATFAKLFRSLFPVATPTVIRLINFENALPPASASNPTEVSPAASPKISGSVSPASSPAAASRSPMSTMFASVAAKLLPRSTIVEPKRSKSSCDIPVMLANFARATAASLALRLVVSPMSIITLVKSMIDSPLIPNCPATSTTFAISS